MTIAPVTGVTAEFVAELNANFSAIDAALNANVPPGALPIGGSDGQLLMAITAGSASAWKYPGAVGITQPNLQTWLQACVDAGTGGIWLYGPVNLTAPVVVNFTSANNYSSMLFDFMGATISPTWSTPNLDMITFICPDTNATEVQVQNLQIKNLNIHGDNGVVRIARNGLVISGKLQQKAAFYGGVISNCNFQNCTAYGFRLYGAVFEMTIQATVSQFNVIGGLELCNPDPATGGVLSAIHIFGCDFRNNGLSGTNGYGIACTSDVAFTQPSNCYVHGGNFIVNSSAGIKAPAGITYVCATHFENNCFLGEVLASIWTQFGFGVYVERCDVEYLSGSGPGKYLCDITNTDYNWIYASSSIITDLGTEILATLGSTATLFLDGFTGSYPFDGSSTWTIKVPSYSDQNYLGTATGTGDAQVIAATGFHTNKSIKALRTGTHYTWTAPNAANTGAATVAIGVVAAVSIVKRVSTVLAAADIPANKICHGIYNGTQMVLQNPATL